jgi:hypothetical protein
MSRILLSRYDDGSNHVVVGWDHPAGGAFWQEWATDLEVKHAELWLKTHSDDNTDESLRYETLAETGVKREGGMFPGIKLSDFRQSVPEDLRHLITDKVMDLLSQHSSDPDSGYVGSPNRGFTDLTQ